MNFETLLKQYQALLIGNWISDLSNTSAFLNEYLSDINWVGFYLLASDQKLYLGPFQGKVACTIIPLTKGVCGFAATNREITMVPDVHQFDGHIACDSRSKSEIVIPLVKGGKLLGVLDVDSPSLNRFSNTEENEFLKKVVELLLENSNSHI